MKEDWILAARNRLTRARRAARLIRVEETPWLVYELEDTYDRRKPALVFESEEIIRRVRDFPTHWRDLSDAALYALSWER